MKLKISLAYHNKDLFLACVIVRATFLQFQLLFLERLASKFFGERSGGTFKIFLKSKAGQKSVCIILATFHLPKFREMGSASLHGKLLNEPGCVLRHSKQSRKLRTLSLAYSPHTQMTWNSAYWWASKLKCRTILLMTRTGVWNSAGTPRILVD